MWLVEVNFAGRRFIREVRAPRANKRCGTLSFGWRHAPIRSTRAA